MGEAAITFDDGAAYEDFMGAWSRLAGQEFLSWLAPRPGLRWADIGCGNGCFSELLFQRVSPSLLDGLDPSAPQLAHATRLLAGKPVRLRQGDAMKLPYSDRSFEMAVMALVIFFVPEPARGLAEMIRVTRPGGTVAAYAWDIYGGGFPWNAVWTALTEMGLPIRTPPSSAASSLEVLGAMWRMAGLRDVAVKPITVRRHYADLESFWAGWLRGPGGVVPLREWPAGRVAELHDRIRAQLDIGADGGFTVSATANAVRGQVA